MEDAVKSGDCLCLQFNIANCAPGSGDEINPPFRPVGQLSQPLESGNVLLEKVSRVIKLVQDEKNSNLLAANFFKEPLNAPIPLAPRSFIFQGAVGGPANGVGQPVQIFHFVYAAGDQRAKEDGGLVICCQVDPDGQKFFCD